MNSPSASPTDEFAAATPLRRRRCLRAVVWTVLGLLFVTTAALLWWMRGALYNRFVRFPREEAAWIALRAQREAVTEDAGWREFRGVLHTHSELSHDSEVPFPEILQVLKATGLDFIGLSDHSQVDGRADFSTQWRGLRDGKLFIPGFEMKDGFMPFGVASHITLSNRTEPATLARQIVQHGGVFFFAHPENPRRWDLPELTGMEIYNLHADFKRMGGSVATAVRGYLPDLLLSLRRFPDHIHRLPFQRPTEFLQRWDELNQTRHITGIAGNDCHQNVGFRGFATPEGTLRIEDTSPRVLKEFRLTWYSRPLLRLFFGPLDPGRILFHVQLDPYERSARFVNTHVLARALTEADVLDALRAGRVFVGFDLIADSSGFRWYAQDGADKTVMGEARALQATTRLRAVAPIPCRFTLVHNGRVLAQQEGRSVEWTPTAPGKYRVEAELRVRDAWVPWIYANPIELR